MIWMAALSTGTLKARFSKHCNEPLSAKSMSAMASMLLGTAYGLISIEKRAFKVPVERAPSKPHKKQASQTPIDSLSEKETL